MKTLASLEWAALSLEPSCQGSSHQADVEEEDWKTNAGNANRDKFPNGGSRYAAFIANSSCQGEAVEESGGQTEVL